jgi:DNA-binding SARP family transcriptional activator
MNEGGWGLPTDNNLKHGPQSLMHRRLDGSMGGSFCANAARLEDARRAVQEPYDRWTSSGWATVTSKTVRPALQARFFGHFEMLYDGGTIPLGRNGKVLAILKYLLARPARVVSQDYLTGWLWPESNREKARSSLSSALYTLRKCICMQTGIPLEILFENGGYRLSPNVRVETDVDYFGDHYKRGLWLERSGQMAEAASTYEKATEIYRGDYLIQDLYEDWTMIDRERLANNYIDMLHRLASHYRKGGNLQASIQACYQVLERDCTHVGSHHLLVQCFLRLGFYGRAYRQYHLFQDIVWRQYGVAPSPEVRALFEDTLHDNEEGCSPTTPGNQWEKNH